MNPQVKKKLLKLIPQFNKHKQLRADITKEIDSFDETTSSLKEMMLAEFMTKRQAQRKKLLKRFTTTDLKTKEVLNTIVKIDAKIGLPLSRGEVIKLEDDPPQPDIIPLPSQTELPI